MLDWDKLRIFYKIVQAGNFTRAADIMNVSQSSLSRQITNLEQSLKMSLFYRHSKGLVLTAQGEILYNVSKEIFAQLMLTEALLNESRSNPQGPLKIASSTAFGTRWLLPCLKEFSALYPGIRLNLVLRDDEVDLNLREADMSLSFHPSTQPNWISTPLPQGRYRLYAGRHYLEKKGVPLKITDLDQHQLIVPGDNAPDALRKMNLPLTLGVKREKTREPYLTINNVWGILQSVKSNLGMAILNRYMVKDEEELVEILPEHDFGVFQKHIVYPEQLKSSKRITAFREFIEQKAQEEIF